DEDEQEQPRVPPPNISPEKARELEDERREIIRSQALRKSSTTAERWSSMDELSSIAAGSGEGRRTGSFTTSFSLCFDKAPSGRAATPVDPENIDTEQINFSAARQQFLMLEKSSPGSFYSPGQPPMSPKPESMTKVSRQEWHSPEMATKAPRGYGNAGGSSQSRTDKTVYQVYSVSYQTPMKDTESNGLDKETKISNETPIEREIRMAMEREETLWKERGIQRLTSSSELVEIQTKPLLSMHSSPGPGRKGKDKGRASLYVRREIEQETKREEDLKRQGRLLGTYDRGTQQELDERRRVFEQEDAAPQAPAPARRADERRSWANESAAEQPTSHGDTKGGRSLPSYAVSTARFQLSPPRFATGEKSWEQVSLSQRGPSASTRSGEDSWGGRLPSSTPSTGTAVLPREYFFLPFWKPKLSFTQGPSCDQTHGTGRGGRFGAGASCGDLSPTRGPGVPHPMALSLEAASGVSGSYSVSGSPVSAPAPHQAGILGLISSFTPLRVAGPSQGSTEPPNPDSARSSPFEERRRRVKEEGKYAGIEPVDKINTEVVESTRVTRHKSAMAQRWEAGQYVRDQD
ncbi:MISP protein, partial [Columbina picui]|nr:MISP protein [Columbina picui]